MALLSFDWLLNLALCSLLFSRILAVLKVISFPGCPFCVVLGFLNPWNRPYPCSAACLVPCWTFPRRSSTGCSGSSWTKGSEAFPRCTAFSAQTWTWKQNELLISIFETCPKKVSKAGQPICTFSDAKGTNGPTAKGATGKGSIFAHSPRLRTSLLRESDLKPTSLDFQQMKDYQKQTKIDFVIALGEHCTVRKDGFLPQSTEM